MTDNQKWWASLKRSDPREYQRRTTLKSLRTWHRNLRAAKRGEGFFKADHCEMMIQLHRQRYMEVA